MAGALALVASLAGCNAILGIGDPRLDQGTAGAGGDGAAVPTGAGGDGGGGEAGGASAGGSGPGGGGPTCDGCTGAIAWSRGWGSSGRSFATAVAIDGDGTIVVAGTSNGTIDFGDGPLSASADGFSIVVAELTAGGGLIWSKRFTGTADERVTGIAFAPNGDVILGGVFDGTIVLDGQMASSSGSGDDDGFVARLDGADGSAVWLQTYGGAGDQGVEGVAGLADGVAVVGHFETSIASPSGPVASVGGSDVFVTHLDGAGAAQWMTIFGSIADEHGRAIAEDGGGGLRIAGEYLGALTVGPDELINDAQLESFVAALDGQGTALWARQIGGNNDQRVRRVDVGPDGSVVAGGALESEMIVDGGIPLTALFGTQQWVAVFDPAGELSSRELYGQLDGSDVDEPVMAPRFDPTDGNLVLAGWFAGSVTIDRAMLTSAPDGADIPSDDVMLAKVAPGGQAFWSQRFGDGAEQRGLDARVAPSRQIVQVGSYRGSITLGEPHDCAATECFFVLVTDP